jgi:hypothetical protein
MDGISAITLFCIGGICLLAAATNAQFDQFGIKFRFRNLVQRLAVGIIGLVFLAAAWKFRQLETSRSVCNVSGTATSSGDGSPVTVTGCGTNPDASAKP